MVQKRNVRVSGSECVVPMSRLQQRHADLEEARSETDDIYTEQLELGVPARRTASEGQYFEAINIDAAKLLCTPGYDMQKLRYLPLLCPEHCEHYARSDVA